MTRTECPRKVRDQVINDTGIRSSVNSLKQSVLVALKFVSMLAFESRVCQSMSEFKLRSYSSHRHLQTRRSNTNCNEDSFTVLSQDFGYQTLGHKNLACRIHHDHHQNCTLVLIDTNSRFSATSRLNNPIGGRPLKLYILIDLIISQ